MIKVLHSPLIEKGQTYNGRKYDEKSTAMVRYSLETIENGIELSFRIWPDYDVEYKATLGYEEYSGKIVEIALVTTDKMNDLKIYPIYNTVVSNSFLQNQSVSDMRVARIVFDETCENIIVLLCKDSDDIEGFSNIVFDRMKESAVGVLARHSKYFAEKLCKRKVKAEMINEVDVYATLAYLEAQVDVLTRVVLTLAPENEYKDLLQAADRHSVLSIKPKEAMIEEFERDKQGVRRLQRRYYDAKRRF